MKKIFYILLLHTFFLLEVAIATDWDTPHNGNPILPGYFADPTIRKFGDTYYIYSTTDGTGNGYGPAQVWMSKDFHHWRNVLLNWPTTEVVWAPDVVQQSDGTYRYYYCTPCEIRVGESSKPIGPWKNRLGPSDAVLVPDRFVTNAITLDPQLFRDDDGNEYLYFGTWGIYKGFGCGVARLAPDGKTFVNKKLIENTEITDFFEAPFVFKKDDIYYFTYSSGSCHDNTYRVQYAISKTGPMGPYEYKGCILQTNDDGTIHGPGHHSIHVENDKYYIVYHRHNNPHAIHGFHRQICIDEIYFDTHGNILPIIPTHHGPSLQAIAASTSKIKLNDLAFGARVTASSTYSEIFRPEYAVDDNNGTLWRAANVAALSDAWLQIDLGKIQKINTILTQFEYATFFYQYHIETSVNGTDWLMFADNSYNTRQDSPLIDISLRDVKARYVRLTITGTQKNGHFPAIWNVKVYRSTPKNSPMALLPEVEVDEQAIVEGYPWIHQKDLAVDVKDHAGMLLNLDASDYAIGSDVQGVPVVPKDGLASWRFTGQHTIQVDTANLQSLVYNAPYTVTAWILNPIPSNIETVANFMPAGNDLGTIELRNGINPREGIVAHNASFENAGAASALKAGQWQHWVVTFDGFMERIYCDGQEVSAKNNFIMLRPGGPITIGSDAASGNPFTGYLHSLRLYNHPFTAAQVEADRKQVTRLSGFAMAAKQIENYQLKLEWLSPSQVQASVTLANGTTLKEGFYDFQIASGQQASVLNSLELSPFASAVLNVQPGVQVYARVTNVWGHVSDILTVPLPKRRRFTDLLKIEQMKLESDSTDFTSDPSTNGPTVTADVTGDFVMECEIADMTGMDAKSTPAYNEGGLILVGKGLEDTQSLIQVGTFPHYNCGNMLTIRNSHIERQQFMNNLGWDFHRRLQIERRGHLLFVRTAGSDGQWNEMPHSPFRCPEGLSGTIKAGIYQTTYSPNRAAVSFRNVHLWTK